MKKLGSISKKYACVSCGYWVVKGVLACGNCLHEFTSDDCDKMMVEYQLNKKEGFSDLVIIMLGVVLLIGLILMVTK
ncbi:MAG: hypothetical protein HRU38_13685 [Saccharospirillaceae bacterium]|nr:hypothetical protein [Pseudomonadales bacterium]NRB79696.1 hypothetical protein [Saccharospirillaceae bacterium]